MLKRLLFLTFTTCCLFTFTSQVIASGLKFENEQVELLRPLQNENGTSYISTSDFIELHRLDFTVNSKKETVLLKKDNHQYNWRVNQNVLETPAGIIPLNHLLDDGYVMLPLRKINTVFGYYTAYDFNTNHVLVSKSAIQDIPKKVEQWEIPTMQLNPTANIQVPIICYHVVSTDRADTLYTPYWKLEEHLKALKDNGYTTITPKQLYEAYYMNKPLPSNPVLITFDDGYYDNYTLGFPLLKKYDMQATIFIIGKWIEENTNTSINGGLPRLSWDNIIEMQTHVTVQNHTFDSHYKMMSTSGKEKGMIASPIQVNGQWETGEQYWIRIGSDFSSTEKLIKEKVGYGSYIFSYPYGEFSYTTKLVLEQLNIPLAVTVKQGIAHKNSSVYELPRIIVNGKWSGNQLINQLNKAK